MTKLSTIRASLASLGRRRQAIRWGAGLAGLALAVMLALVAVFLLDWLFQRSIDAAQRVILELLAFAAVVWAFQKFTQPWLARREDNLQMALLVEKKQRIDSDLVAALQFEQPEAASWGSKQLESAVIDRVAEMGPRLDFLEGAQPDVFYTRAAWCAVAVGGIVIAAVLCPGHFRAFLNRLAGGSMHYPSRTRIERLVVNHEAVFSRSDDHYQPKETKTAESRAVEFAVVARGDLPEEGLVQVAGAQGQRRDISLRKLSLDERLARLAEAASRVEAARLGKSKPGEFKAEEVAALARLDAPRAALLLSVVDQPLDLFHAQSELMSAHQNMQADQGGGTSIYVGQLGRLYSSVSYKTLLGDCWTDRATVKQIDLPVIQSEIVSTPPAYARLARPAAGEQGERALSVVEGTSVVVNLTSSNKPLEKAWLAVKTEKDPAGVLLSLSREDKEGRKWRFDDPKSALGSLRESIAYELQVRDVDGLSLPEPIRGRIAVRPDRPPVVTCVTDVRVKSGDTEISWLPDARPRLRFTVRDDYAVGRVVLHVKALRKQKPLWEDSLPIRSGDKPISGSSLPYQDVTTLDLGQLQTGKSDAPKREKLAPGDRLEVVLEAWDDRGGASPQSGASEIVELPIGKDSNTSDVVIGGIKSAEQKATDSINTQSDTGDSP